MITSPTPLRHLESLTLLEGVRVVELSHTVSGAYCGKVLAQLGACVVRARGDTALTASPATAALMQRVLNGAKRELEPTDPSFAKAVAEAHIVVVEQFAPSDAAAELVRALVDDRRGMTKGAVLLTLSAAGVEEDRRTPACGLTSAAASGMVYAIGDQGKEPLTLPYDLVHYQAGVNGACAAIAALLGGQNTLVDVAARDVLANLVGTLALNYLPYGRPWRREGTRPSMSGGVYPCGLFPCKDGYVALYCRGNHEWMGLVNAMGTPAWSSEPRFADARVVATRHADEADSHLMPWLAKFTRHEVQELGARFGFPAAPVRYVREALDDSQFAYRGSFDSITGAAGDVKVPAAPWRLYQPANERVARNPLPAAGLGDAPRPPAKILAGLHVLDFTWVWSGPMVTAILADLGAEVIKVEHPSHLDSLRQRGRPLRDGIELEGPSVELNPWFNQLNHAKKSVVLDMKSDEGRAALRRLATTCDVVVENMRPGALADAGLGYVDLAADNTSLVMLSMSMAGQSGPLSQMKGYAGIMTSMAGLESIVGYESAERDAPFTGMTMTALGDPNGAAHGVAVLLAALHRRRTTGCGTWIDLAQTDAILAIMAAPIVESQLLGYVPIRGNARPDCFPHGHFPCRGADQWVAIAVVNDAQWRALVEVVGTGLEGFTALSLRDRQARGPAITQAIAEWAATRDAGEIVSRLGAHGVPAAPVATYESMLASEWKSHRRLSRTVEHPWLKTQEVFVPPWHFAGVTPGVDAPAPLLGQHTDEVLHNAHTATLAIESSA